MSRVFKPKLNKDQLAYEQDDTTTAGKIYTRFGNTTKNQYIERQSDSSPYIHEWTWGAWTNRAFITNWVAINEKYIDF